MTVSGPYRDLFIYLVAGKVEEKETNSESSASRVKRAVSFVFVLQKNSEN
jgi:hypothetical protein